MYIVWTEPEREDFKKLQLAFTLGDTNWIAGWMRDQAGKRAALRAEQVRALRNG